MATLRVTYIGDAVTAGGLMLIGVEARVTPAQADATWQSLRAARQTADLVILNQAHADLIRTRLQEWIAAEPAPPVVELPTMDSSEAARDRVVAPARRALGLS